MILYPRFGPDCRNRGVDGINPPSLRRRVIAAQLESAWQVGRARLLVAMCASAQQQRPRRAS